MFFVVRSILDGILVSNRFRFREKGTYISNLVEFNCKTVGSKLSALILLTQIAWHDKRDVIMFPKW